jgi:signal transduction histidine kinase
MVTREGALDTPLGEESFGFRLTTALQGFLDAAWSARDVTEAAGHGARFIRAAAGRDCQEARILLLSRGGQLRPVAADGPGVLQGRRRSARRREVLHTGRARSIALRRPGGFHLALLPLEADGDAFGITEIVVAERITEARWTVLHAVASQVALAIRSARTRIGLDRQVEALSRSARLAGALLEARTAPGAILAAASFCFERFDLPVACWWAKSDPGRLSLLGVRGFGSRRRASLRAHMASIPRWAFLPPAERVELIERFGQVAGLSPAASGRGVSVVDAGAALLLVGGDEPDVREALQVVRSLLVEALANLERVRSADRRNEQLDLGIAWTAHEVRGPLRGVKAVIDLLLATTGEDQPMRELLERSSDELDVLAGKVEGVLRWSIGHAPLRRRSMDLVDVVRRAIESCGLETGERRVALSGPDRVPVLADHDQLRSAVANLVRNAIAYSPADTQVLVRVRDLADRVTVSVRDQGGGIHPAERETIFDPFVRGKGGVGRGAGAGLGLFIARRIAEAHGGYLWMESSPLGTTFHMGLPRQGPVPGVRGVARNGSELKRS